MMIFIIIIIIIISVYVLVFVGKILKYFPIFLRLQKHSSTFDNTHLPR